MRHQHEHMLMQAVQERHCTAPLQKQRAAHVQDMMQALSLHLVQQTPGYVPVAAGVEAGIVRAMAAGRAATTDTVYYNAFEQALAWASRVGVPALPMSPFSVMCYLCEL